MDFGLLQLHIQQWGASHPPASYCTHLSQEAAAEGPPSTAPFLEQLHFLEFSCFTVLQPPPPPKKQRSAASNNPKPRGRPPKDDKLEHKDVVREHHLNELENVHIQAANASVLVVIPSGQSTFRVTKVEEEPSQFNLDAWNQHVITHYAKKANIVERHDWLLLHAFGQPVLEEIPVLQDAYKAIHPRPFIACGVDETLLEEVKERLELEPLFDYGLEETFVDLPHSLVAVVAILQSIMIPGCDKGPDPNQPVFSFVAQESMLKCFRDNKSLLAKTLTSNFDSGSLRESS